MVSAISAEVHRSDAAHWRVGAQAPCDADAAHYQLAGRRLNNDRIAYFSLGRPHNSNCIAGRSLDTKPGGPRRTSF